MSGHFFWPENKDRIRAEKRLRIKNESGKILKQIAAIGKTKAKI